MRSQSQKGFFIIEAMISFLVMSFGILALASMQIKISRDADVSKQRVEALRLAQQRMETMRGFTTIAVDASTPADPDRNGSKKLAWTDLATDTDRNNPLTSPGFSNASFTRSWTVSGSTTDASRGVNVVVAWTDRDGTAQKVALNSVISQSDPLNAAALGFPLPANTNLKLPKNRSLNIPVPATDLGNGKSVYQLSPNLAIVFSNVTGNVVEKCTTTVSASSYNAGTAGCTTYNAFILAGYISGAIANSSLQTPTLPTGVNSTSVSFDTSTGRSISCSYAVAQDQTTSAFILSSHYYLCVIPVATTNGSWSGTVRLGGIPTSANYKVCRFQYDGLASDSSDVQNQRNVQPYVRVSGSLDNQNYYIENSSSNSCPVVQNVQTLLHQDCRNSSTPSVTNCPATSLNTPAT